MFSRVESERQVFLRFGCGRFRFRCRCCRRDRQSPDWRGKSPSPREPRKAGDREKRERLGAMMPHPIRRGGQVFRRVDQHHCRGGPVRPSLCVSARSARSRPWGGVKTREDGDEKNHRAETQGRRDAETVLFVSHRRHKSHKRWKFPCVFCAFLWLKTGDFRARKVILRVPGGVRAEAGREDVRCHLIPPDSPDFISRLSSWIDKGGDWV